LFTTEEMAGEVETSGELTTGATVFDRRQIRMWRCNMEVATHIDVAAVKDCLIRGLHTAGQRG
jgi:purine nucleosidase